ncbi:MAG: FAD-dependent oxidoreductase [Gammaproteobacteria bacterium]|nr:FAD-dependent oxidoreductase [Gammaproteobacteria bacterium]
MSRVVVVGSGNAGLCAALSAAQQGADVIVVEAGGEADFGGNSRYTAGAMRFAYRGRDDVLGLVDAQDPHVAACDFGAYPEAEFEADLRQFSDGAQLNPLQRLLVRDSRSTLRWLTESGVSFEPIYSRQAVRINGRYRFWGGLTLAAVGEGESLINRERSLAKAAGCEFALNAPVTALLQTHAALRQVKSRVCGVRTASGADIIADAVVLACGGFEANADERAVRLGAAWRSAKVRGTALNQGAGLTLAQSAGAALAGDFERCHAVCMDTATPDFRDSAMPHVERRRFRRISYPFGVMLNRRGERFVDEGADFRNYTYAQYGAAVLEQPGAVAWQIFDAAGAKLLYDDYFQELATHWQAPRLSELIDQLPGIDRCQAMRTLDAYNASAPGEGFDPTIKDGCAARGLDPPKSNWATPLLEPPFHAFEVTCGITFTYGGLAVDVAGRVLDGAGRPVPGLFAAGEIVGGLFFDGYPGGSGLTAGAVMGRRSGASAAQVY